MSDTVFSMVYVGNVETGSAKVPHNGFFSVHRYGVHAYIIRVDSLDCPNDFTDL